MIPFRYAQGRVPPRLRAGWTGGTVAPGGVSLRFPWFPLALETQSGARDLPFQQAGSEPQEWSSTGPVWKPQPNHAPLP